MRILWITHDPIRTTIGQGHSSSGFWKEALLKLLKSESADTITIAFPGKLKTQTASDTYQFRYPNKSQYKDLPNSTVEDLLWIIDQVKPDLIHVHGTEIPYGLIIDKINIPVVVSLQGFISEWYQSIMGDIAIPLWKKKKTLKEFVLKNSFMDMHCNWYHNASCEKEVVKKNKYFIGRTHFDKNFVFKNNQDAVYFTGNELLRDDFYDNNWALQNINRHSIYTSSFSNPVKGFHLLLEASAYLINEFPDLKIIVPGNLTTKTISPVFGNAYFRLIHDIIEKYNLHKHLQFSGKLEGKDIASILQKVHLFAMPSFMENSSNALGEALLTGTPCVVSNCGGTSSIIINEENGVIFDRGDAYDLSNKIRSIFLDDELSLKLSQKGKLKGKEFHSRSKILDQYSSIYKSVLASENTI